MFKSSFLFASSCGYDIFNPEPLTFCETPHSSLLAKIVITKNRTEEDLVDVKVLETLSGVLPDSLTIREQDGVNLNAIINTIYYVGDTLLVDLYNDSFYQEKGYYGISICGVHILKVENDSLVGSISSGIDKMSYNDFKKTTCAKIVSTANKQSIQEVTIYPNPATNQVEITSSSFVHVYQLVDIHGKIIEEKINEHWQNYSLDISTFSSGIYFLKLETDDRIITKKIIKL